MNCKINILKALDKTIGWLAVQLAPPAAASTGPPPQSFLIIRPGGIGDAVLLLPMILALRNAFPESCVTVLAEKRNAGVFDLVDGISKVYVYDRPSDLCAMLSHNYDVVIDTEQWHRLSAVVGRIIRSQMYIGFSTNSRKRLFSHPVKYHLDEHETQSFIRLMGPFLDREHAEVRVPFLAPLPESLGKVEGLLRPLSGARFAAIFPGASIPEKRWGAANFHAVAAGLHLRGYSVVIVGGKTEYALGEAIINDVTGLNLTGKATLSEVAAVIAQSCLLISGDSGILHIGAALGLPTVSLFGPSNPWKWGPVGNCSAILRRELPCSPCSLFGYTPSCRYGVKCMTEITVADVLAAVDEVTRGEKSENEKKVLT